MVESLLIRVASSNPETQLALVCGLPVHQFEARWQVTAESVVRHHARAGDRGCELPLRELDVREKPLAAINRIELRCEQGLGEWVEEIEAGEFRPTDARHLPEHEASPLLDVQRLRSCIRRSHHVWIALDPDPFGSRRQRADETNFSDPGSDI